MQTEKKRVRNIICLFVKRDMKKKHVRNGILILSVALVTIMLTVMFGAGISIFENVEKAELRIRGSSANGFLPEATEKEIEKLRTVDGISDVGIQSYIAKLNNIENLTDKQNIVMTGYSRIEWEKHILPTISDLQGTYPKLEDEVMISQWTLDKLGINEPEVGMVVILNYTLLSGETQEKEFKLSGYFKDYVYQAGTQSNSGNVMAANQYFFNQGSSQNAVGNVVVSGIFAKQNMILDGSEAMFLVDKKLGSDKALDILSGNLGRKDAIVSGLTKNWSKNFSLVGIPMIAVLLILISGYLLIYNIVNISLIQDMHIYGQLKTLGATSHQIRRIIRSRVNYIVIIGIPIGLCLGILFSKMIIPGFLSKLTEGNGFGDALSCDVVISPLIYIFSVLFSYLTIVVSCQKSARMVENVSPVESLHFIEHTEKLKVRRTENGGKLYRMAYRNVFRSKKRAIITFASLFLGFLIYIIISMATYSVDYEIKYKAEIPDSFRLTNLSYKTDDQQRIQDVFSNDIIRQIEKIDGVQSISYDYVENGLFQDSSNKMRTYLKEQAMYAEKSEQEVAKHFEARAVGLQTEKLLEFNYKSTFSAGQIKKFLKEGNGIFLPDNGEVNFEEITGATVNIICEKSTQSPVTYTVLGVLMGDNSEYIRSFTDYGNVNYGNATSFYTSEEGIRKLIQKPMIHTLRIQSDCKKDTGIQNQLLDIFAKTDAVSIDSQLQTYIGVSDMIEVMQIIGMAFAGFLVFMGIINFINVIFTNIYSRQKELATLESIGMTRRQLRIVLSLEGLYYCLITLGLLSTLGLGIAYVVLKLIRNGLIYFAGFGIPIMQFCFVFGVMILICLTVPVLLFNSIVKETVVERLRKEKD